MQSDDASRTVQKPRGVLTPAARRRAQIDDRHPKPPDPVGALNLIQFEDRARSVASLTRALHEHVALVLGEPATTGFGTFDLGA